MLRIVLLALVVVILLLSTVGFIAWSVLKGIDEECYMTEKGYEVVKVVDSTGEEYSPWPLSLKDVGGTGWGCGIDQDAKPFRIGERYLFKIPDGGIVPLQSSLTGRSIMIPNNVEVGLDDGGDWDEMPLWPLKGMRWGDRDSLFKQ